MRRRREMQRVPIRALPSVALESATLREHLLQDGTVRQPVIADFEAGNGYPVAFGA
jgi:hypothetical protein